MRQLETRGKTTVAAEVNSRFATTLLTHERILERVSAKEENVKIKAQPKVLLRPLLDRVRAEVKAAAEVKIRAEKRINIKLNNRPKSIETYLNSSNSSTSTSIPRKILRRRPTPTSSAP